MPDKWPLANGNWSTAANWNDGTKPVAGDDVYADGRTVTLDENVTVSTIRNTARSGGTAGGVFNTSGTRIITANLIQGAANLVNANADLTINGNVTGGTGGGQACIQITGSISNLIINGNVTGGSGSGGRGISSDRAENTIITGNLTGGTASGTEGYYINFGGGAITGSIVVNGNVTAGSGANAINFNVGPTTKPITVNGSLTGNVVSAINMSSTGNAGNIVVNGVVSGGTTGHGIAVAGSNSPNIDVTGNCLGSTSSTGVAITYSGTGRVRVVGDIYAGFGGTGVALGSTSGINRISGNLYSSSTGWFPISGGGRVVIDNTVTRTITARADNAGAVGDEFGYSTDTTNFPATSNVRFGTTYGAGGLQVGTCRIPAASSVAAGVLVDNTVGTAVITESVLRAALGLASANLDIQLAAKPTLADIEASSIIAKQATSATIVERTSRIPNNPATSEQITSLQNNAPTEAF